MNTIDRLTLCFAAGWAAVLLMHLLCSAIVAARDTETTFVQALFSLPM